MANNNDITEAELLVEVFDDAYIRAFLNGGWTDDVATHLANDAAASIAARRAVAHMAANMFPLDTPVALNMLFDVMLNTVRDYYEVHFDMQTGSSPRP